MVKFYYLHSAFMDMKEGVQTWNKELLSTASAPLVDLLDHLIVYRPEDRLCASDCIRHPWTSHGDPTQEAMSLDMTNLFQNMLSYRDLTKFERIVLNLIGGCDLSHTASTTMSERMLALRRVFQGVDENKNGILDVDEFIAFFRKNHSDAETDAAEALLRKLFADIDVAGNGVITFSEFVAVSIG